MLDPLEELGGRSRVRTPIESDVDQDIRVQQHQRYLRASASYRPSAPPCRFEPAPPARRERRSVLTRHLSKRRFDERRQRNAARLRVLLGPGNQLILHRDCQLSLHGRAVRFANTYATHRIRVVPEGQLQNGRRPYGRPSIWPPAAAAGETASTPARSPTISPSTGSMYP